MNRLQKVPKVAVSPAGRALRVLLALGLLVQMFTPLLPVTSVRPAFADNTDVSGDSITTVNGALTLGFGTVCAGATIVKPVLLDISRNGNAGSPNVFKDGATVTVTAVVNSGAGLSATNGGTITLPANWGSLANNTSSTSVTSNVTLQAGAAGSSFTGQITYAASGPNSSNTQITRTATLAVTATVSACDTTPPTLSLPGNQTVEATSAAGAMVTFTATATDQNPANPTVTCSPASGSTFPLGTTAVNCSATDAAGNTARGSFTVTVRDTTKPVITGIPSDQTAEATGATGATASWTAPTATDTVDGTVSVSCDHTSGSTFPLGTTTVTCSATDRHGNTATSTFVVKVQDTTAPTLQLPNSQTVEAGSPNGAAASWTTPTATDTVDGTLSVSCDHTSGDTFPLGTTTVTCSTRDKAGNTATGSFTITVQDTGAPLLSLPADQTVEAIGSSGAPSTFTASATDTVDGSVPVTCTPASGSTFPLGTTTVACSARDNSGNTATGSFTVKVQDTTPPTLTGIPGNQTVEATGATGATASWTAPTATDTVDGTVSVSCDHTSGSTFPLGKTTVSCSATDSHGNTAIGSFTVTIQDTTPPALTLPTSVVVEATGPTGAPASWTAPTASDLVDGAIPVTCDHASGETFPLDTTTVACSAKDKAGNTAIGSFTVTIQDTTPPVLTLPADIVAEATSPSGAVVTFQATATDLVDGAVPVACTPASGSTFPFGDTTVTCSAADSHGNSTKGSSTFTVKVQDTTPPTITEKSRTPAANVNGWNNTDVTVSFTCTDSGSGVASCADVTLTNEAADQTATGVAVDNAGNSAGYDAKGINIDKTPPTLSGAPTAPANAAGWYKGDVTIHWTAADGLSGIDPATQPADSFITGEGSNLGAGPVSVSDKAGNSTAASVNGIKIDRTPPALTGAPTSSPNGAGWYNGAVTVHFTCSDTLSGVATCPGDKVVNTDGANQSVTSDPATDLAGNQSAGKTVGGINIDSKAPQTSANNQCDGKNGWCKGQTATVVLTATDQPGLSGVKEIHYIVNGGQEKVASGASVSVNVPLAAKSGLATVQFYAVDNAGNPEPMSGVSLKYDNIAPTVTHTVNPAANAAGWNNANTTVHFDAVDDDGGSGVDPTTVTPDQTVSTETTTAGQIINGEASDLAGNKGTDSVTIRLDKTPPTISGAPTAGPNANGWYNSAVTVHFTCGDALSGIATCTPDMTLTTEGAGQSVTGTAVDKAGNSTSKTVSGINIDATGPAVTVNGIASGAVYMLGAVPAASCTATDTGSGLDGACQVTVTGGLANGVGTFTYTATAKDKAGNTTTQTGSYRVIYRFDGFLQPINDTAHQVGTTTSIFKGGSTVPAKFQLMKADGTVIQANSLPQWLTPAMGSVISAPVNETAYSDPATSGTTYRWDSTAQQYIYNWSTKGATAGYYYRIGVTLDDGQTYYVNIGLR